MKQDWLVSNSTIGAAIKRRRHELLWSLEKLGNMLDVSGQQIQRYESGANSLTVEKLQEIANALSVPICYFFLDNPSPKAAQQIECYEFFRNFANLQNIDMKAMVMDFVRIAARKNTERIVPALQLGSFWKHNPILLVDDDEHALTITKLFLEYEGYHNLHLIRDSRAVISFMKENKVSLVLLDIRMPNIAGNDLLCTIKKDFPTIPVIVVTAIRDMAIADECKKMGAMDYLVKPVAPDILMTAIVKSMNN